MSTHDHKSCIRFLRGQVYYSIKLVPDAKTKWTIDSQCQFQFNTKEEYVDFVKSWKEHYRILSKSIRMLKKPMAFIGCNLRSVTYVYGKYVHPDSNLHVAMFALKAQAKALMQLRLESKKLARKQREEQDAKKLSHE
jgi:hypothetical protein